MCIIRYTCAVDCIEFYCELSSVVWISCFVLERITKSPSKCKLILLTYIGLSCVCVFFSISFTQTYNYLNICAENCHKYERRENEFGKNDRRIERKKYVKMHKVPLFNLACMEKVTL